QHARDAIANVVRGTVDVPIEAELDGDARALVLTRGGDLFDPLEAGDAIFDHLSDLRLDDGCRRASIHRIDADDRGLNVRDFAYREASRGHQADDREQQTHDHREHGPANRDFRDDHVGTSVVRASATSACRTGCPSRTSSMPPTIT